MSPLEYSEAEALVVALDALALVKVAVAVVRVYAVVVVLAAHSINCFRMEAV